MSHDDLLKKPAIMLFVGKPARGKSNAIKYFIIKNAVERKRYQFGLVFTRTKFNKDYDYIDPKYVIGGYDEDVLKRYLSAIENKLEQGKEVGRNFIVFDDLIGLLSKHDKFLINFFATHRHTKTDVYMATQHLNTGANTTLRECCTYAFMFGSKQFNTIRSLYENFGQLFDTIEEFKKRFYEVTSEPFTAMLYLGDEDDVEKNYLRFKAPDVSKLKVKVSF